MSGDATPAGIQCDYPKRFSWKMRVFLSLFLGDMVLRSFLSLSPYDSQWSYELSVELFPKRLPTQAEFNQIAAGTHPNGQITRSGRLLDSVTSIGPYFSPVPSEATQAHLQDAVDYCKYAIVWTASRLRFAGSLIGVDQNWPMFSPNVGNDDTVGRIRLVFADGSTRIWYSEADPPDITQYSHWFQEKQLQVATKLYRDQECRLGYCNWLTHQVPNNSSGSPLTRIEMFKVNYVYPTPWQDAFAFLDAQRAAQNNREKSFWTYDVATRKSTHLE
jgi:hypothetical protein